MKHTFFVHFFAVFFAQVQRETSRNFLVTRFMEEMSYVFSFTFFFTAAHFLLALVAASISHFVTAPTKFSCCSSNKNMSPLPLSLAMNPCRPFSRWALLACGPLSLFLYLSSCSIFQIRGHDNLSKLNTLDNTDTETISAFRFRLYWLFCCLSCFTRRRWLCDFPPK